jgi:hypothetical protein
VGLEDSFGRRSEGAGDEQLALARGTGGCEHLVLYLNTIHR